MVGGTWLGIVGGWVNIVGTVLFGWFGRWFDCGLFGRTRGRSRGEWEGEGSVFAVRVIGRMVWYGLACRYPNVCCSVR